MSPGTYEILSDLALVERHREGDRAAFEEVYQRYSKLVFNLAYRMSGNPADAEDLSQEIFVRIYRHLRRFNGKSALKTWVYRVSINHCRSRLGRKTLETRELAEESERGVQLVDERRDPEQRVLAVDASRTVERGLRSLNPMFREAVVLRDLEGLSYDEIARVLGVRIGTVRSRIARGRERLRAQLETKS